MHRFLATALLFWFASDAQAGFVTWDNSSGDGQWTTATNWDSDALPSAGDVVTINNGDTVNAFGLTPSGNLPNNLTVNLENSSTLTWNGGGAIRTAGATLNVGSGSALSGGFWDLNNATINFADGAIANMTSWEQKGTNVFNFSLGASGFSTLTPTNFFMDANSAVPAATKISQATYNVDLAAYTGGTGVFTLVDFANDQQNAMDNATFQNAGGLNILNAGIYTANLQWNDATEAIELNITSAAVPEPSGMLLCGCAGLAFCVRKRKRNRKSAHHC